MKKQLPILILFICASIYSSSQISFQKTFKTGGGGNGFSFLQTSDSGYVAVGYTSNTIGVGSADVYLIKTDANGDTMWTKTYGGTGDDAGWYLQQTNDNGYIITGFTNSFGAGNEDVYLIRTDENGDTLWTKTYGEINNDRGNCVQQTKDDGFIITGFTNDFGAGLQDIFLIKTDANGDTSWTKTFGGTLNDLGASIVQTSDDGYIITGLTNSFGSGNGDVYLIKTDVNGDTLWTKTIGGPEYDYGYSVQQTIDSGFIVTGFMTGSGPGDVDVYLFKTNPVGDVLWSKTYGGIGDDRGRSVQQTSDSGYVIAGWTYSFGSGNADFYLIKTDTNGDTLWTKIIGGTSDDQARSVRQTADGGYILTGGSGSFGTSYDFYIVKTDANGNSSCNQTNSPTIVTSPLTQVTTGTSTIVTSTTCLVTSPASIVSTGGEVSTICSSVGVDKVESKNALTIFPNPSNGNFFIEFEKTIQKGFIVILNITGENVFESSCSYELKKEIILKNNSPGIYFVKVFDGEKYYCRKIIMQHP